MKSIIKLVLVVCLFSSVAFAEGEMTNGGKTCPTGTTCLITTEPTDNETTSTESTDSVLTTVQEYLNSMLEYFEN